MPRTRGNALLMAWTDVDPEHEAAFNDWYDNEHMLRLGRIPGFLSGARYRALRGGPKYLAMYELDDHTVMRTTAFLDEVRFRPSPTRTRISPSNIGRNFLLNTYRRIFPIMSQPADETWEPAPFLQMGRMDIPAVMEDEFNDWYNTVFIPDFLTVPGVLRARRFRAVEAEPKYLTVYEFAHGKVSDSSEWAAARDRNPWTRRVRPHLKLDAGSPAVFERIWPK